MYSTGPSPCHHDIMSLEIGMLSTVSRRIYMAASSGRLVTLLEKGRRIKYLQFAEFGFSHIVKSRRYDA